MAIRWGKRYQPKKADRGHSVIQYGYGPDKGYGMTAVRTYVRCECGERLSGQGLMGGETSYRRHLARERAEREADLARERAEREAARDELSRAAAGWSDVELFCAYEDAPDEETKRLLLDEINARIRTPEEGG
jgi:hypothetical protein